MKKIIGLIPLYDDEKESYWMLPGYMRMLEAEGALPLMLPLTDDPAELADCLALCGGLLLTGGHDVSPSLYGEARKPWCGESCALRDRMEMYLLREAIKKGRSVLGICRGVQFMNACFGGDLYQDLEKEHKSAVGHHMTPPYDRAVHEVTILPGTPLSGILGKERIGVNSYHHQAVKTLAPGFRAAAVSEDGLIESIYLPERKFVLGVQWHPEFSYESDENSQKLVSAFVSSI